MSHLITSEVLHREAHDWQRYQLFSGPLHRCWAELESGVASVNGMALNDKSHFKPTHNYRRNNAPSWCAIDEELPVS